MMPTTRTPFGFLVIFGGLLLIASCAKQVDFANSLRHEIEALGGTPRPLAPMAGPNGSWVVHRDKLGAAIDTEGISFEVITNSLTRAYGEPRFYSGANERHGPTYVYVPENPGISIFVSSTEKGAEVTLAKPF